MLCRLEYLFLRYHAVWHALLLLVVRQLLQLELAEKKNGIKKNE
jgi:hypothetical protein